MPENKPLFEVEAQPPTPEEIERQRVREEYRAKLAEKLKDPEFRRIEGFPIGTDEAILSLSDPPYYTACPNPFIEEWLKEHGKPFDPDTDDYHREPFAADVSEGRNNPIYNAHGYHTKVPHRAIMRYILHYTEPGDVVYDGFCGTGMTGVAAQLCSDRAEVEALGYKVDRDGYIWDKEAWASKQALESGNVNPHSQPSDHTSFSRLGGRMAFQNDLSPAATFIASNYNIPSDIDLFQTESTRILRDLEAQQGWMYATLHDASPEEIRKATIAIKDCSSMEAVKSMLASLAQPTSPIRDSASRMQFGRITYTVWSELLVCPHCGRTMAFWDVAVDRATDTVAEEFSCPHCHAHLTKRACSRATSSSFDPVLKQVTTQTSIIPVLLTYKVGRKSAEREPSAFDLALFEIIQRLPSVHWAPSDPLPDGDKTGEPVRAGITHVHQFYFPKDLRVISQAVFEAERSPSKSLLTLGITSLLVYASKLSRWRMENKSGPLSGTLYVSSTMMPLEALTILPNRYKRIAKARRLLVHQTAGLTLTETCSSTTSRLPTESVDYIFTDPPFGSNFMYSELNFLWESWLRVRTNNHKEAIINAKQHKKLLDYQGLMLAAFSECYRILRPGRWMTVEFHNSANAVWNAIQEALVRAGFIVADVRTLDKKQGNFNQVTASGAVKQDLIITCYKPHSNFQERFQRAKGEVQGVLEFLTEHLRMLPVAPITRDGRLETVAERTRFMLFDRMVAYHLQQGARIPLGASEFYRVLDEQFYERDMMYFLAEQVVRYDSTKARGIEVAQLSIFVQDEKSAVEWIRGELAAEPQSLGDLRPKFMLVLKEWDIHEPKPELHDLLREYFIRESDEKWVMPDPDNERHLEEIRKKSMLREFQEYVRRTGQLKTFRTEAVLAGFAHCWDTKQYDVIVGVCEKIPSKILQEIQDMVMFYDIAKERAPQKVAQFEFKWE